MKKILVFGAGKSSGALISYLGEKAENREIHLSVADASLSLLQDKTGNYPTVSAVLIDIKNEAKRFELISEADIVISLMPPALHLLIANDCLRAGKHLLTASYADDAMRSLSAAATRNDLLFLCECGLDPGIDHMSAMRLIDQIKSEGGEISSFRSHCGGLIAPESDTNDWHYKISWNPRNIVLAGKAGARYRSGGETVSEHFPAVFDPQREPFRHPGLSSYSYYPNRDSIPYLNMYGLPDAKEFLRTTIRHKDFIAGWRALINLVSITEDPLIQTPLSLKNFFISFLAKLSPAEFESFESDFIGAQLFQLGINDSTIPEIPHPASTVDYLQFALEKHWRLSPSDKDLVLMYHEITFDKAGKEYCAESLLTVKGKDERHTAMSMTVGLPLGICAMMLAQNKIALRGVQIPVHPELYLPVLKELEKEGLQFREEIN